MTKDCSPSAFTDYVLCCTKITWKSASYNKCVVYI